MAKIKIVDQSLRDGQQSWWGLRMRPDHMLEIAADVDRAGFEVVEITGSAMFEVWVRQFRENPWHAIDELRAAMPNTQLRAGTRVNASAGSGFTMAPLSVVDLFATLLVKHGIDGLWIYDCLYNMDLMERLSRVITTAGGAATPTLMYSLSEFHTDEFFADKVRQIASWGVARSIFLEDASGVLTPGRARTLIPALQQAAAGIPIELHCHNTTGLAPLNYIEGIDLGIDILHTASEPVANGPSLPSTEGTLTNIRALGHTADIDEDVLVRMAGHITEVGLAEGYEIGRPAEYSLFPYEHQVPGGMLGTFQSQLAQHGISHRLDEALHEAARVRRELGSPVMATPISQLVGIQALLNVTTGERYGRVPDDVINYTLGRLGSPPGPIDQDVKDKILSSDRARELATWEVPQPSLADLRREHGMHLSDEELFLRVLMQGSLVDSMYTQGPTPMGWRKPPESPVAALLQAFGDTTCDTVSYQGAGLSVSLHRN